MPSQIELDRTYMGVANLHAKLSKAERKKVGACLVTRTGIIIPGYNGNPAGMSNVCEDENNATLPSVIHAELNCILKAAKEGVSCENATIYITLSPCEQCAAMLVQAGVKTVVYSETYRSQNGLSLLYKAGIIYRRVGELGEIYYD